MIEKMVNRINNCIYEEKMHSKTIILQTKKGKILYNGKENK